MKKPFSSFFNLPQEEQEKVLKRVIRKSNQDQKKYMDTEEIEAINSDYTDDLTDVCLDEETIKAWVKLFTVGILILTSLLVIL